MDKTLKITFYKNETSGIKILKFTRGQIIGFFIPRILFNSELKENPYFQNIITNSGIYFLSGDKVYIGQALNLYERLKGHIREQKKEFKEIICFTTTDNSFGEGDINFLEKTIIEIADKEGRFNLMNLTKGNNGNPEIDRISDLNSYLEEIKFLLNILGYKFLEKIVSNQNKKENLYLIERLGVKAQMVINEKGYVILSGSFGKNNEANTMLSGYKKLKNELLNKGILEIKNDQIIFVKDYDFSSSTAPAQILLGYSISGPEVWKSKENGKNLKEIEKNNLKND